MKMLLLMLTILAVGCDTCVNPEWRDCKCVGGDLYCKEAKTNWVYVQDPFAPNCLPPQAEKEKSNE